MMDTYLVDLIYEHSDYETKCDVWRYIPQFKARTMKLIRKRLDKELEWKAQVTESDDIYEHIYFYSGTAIDIQITMENENYIVIKYQRIPNPRWRCKVLMYNYSADITYKTRSIIDYRWLRKKIDV